MKIQIKTLCTAAILALAVAGAAKAEDAKIKSSSFSIKVPFKSDINVTSSDGTKWDTIVPQTFPLWADAVVDTRHPGYVERVGIWLGQCTGSGCGNHPRLFFDAPMARDWKFHRLFSFDTGKIPVSKGGIPIVSVGDDILNACNTQLQSDGATKQHSQNVRMSLSLSVNTRKALSINYQILEAGDAFKGGDVSRHTGFNVKVNCLAFQGIQAPPKPVSVDIRVKQKGKTCPKDTEVTAYIDYDKPMTARFRVIHNGKEPKSTPIEIKARKVSFAGKTWYRVERMERYELDPGKHSFKIKVMGGGMSPKKTITVDCPPFNPTSMWLTLNKSDKATCPKNVDAKVRINANGPGSVLTKIKNQAGVVMAIESIKVQRDGDDYVGRLTKSFNMTAIDTMLMAEDVNDPAHNSGWQALKISCLEVLSGTLQQRGLAASLCKGEAALSIRANQPGDLPFRLECTGGRAWDGKVQAHETGPNTFIGVKILRFDVSNNELVRCALRTRQPLPFKLLAGAKRTYACHRTTGVSGSDDLVSETRPDAQQPKGPDAVIDARPQMSCDGGVVKNDACLCPRTLQRVKTGKNAYRCVRTAVIDPVRPDKADKTVDAVPNYDKKTREDAEADRRRIEALKKRQEAKKRAEAANRRKAAKKAAEAKRKREAAKKAAKARRKREAAKKAAELKRKREAAKKAAELKRKREAAKRAAKARRKRKVTAEP